MRAILLTVFGFSIASCLAPRTTPSQTDYAAFAQPTPRKDTLFLVKDEPASRVLIRVWDQESVLKRPSIVLVDSMEMVTIKKRLSYDKKN